MTVRPAAMGIAAFFSICVLFEVRFTVEEFYDLIHQSERAREPFSLGAQGDNLTGLDAGAKAAGFTDGDRLIAIDGKPVLGIVGVGSVVRRHHPGDVLDVTTLHTGASTPVHIKLTLATAERLQPREWVLVAFLGFLTPWFCILLGFFVVFLRPNDPLAWLLLMLMLSFADVGQGSVFLSVASGWGTWMRVPAGFFHGVLNGTWALWMMLFGQYFPNRVANRWWDRMARVFLGIPLAVLGLFNGLGTALAMEDASALVRLQHAMTRFASALLILYMVAICTFFVNISMKMSSAKTTDDRRRLKLLYWGATISLTPLFLVVVASLVMRRSFSGYDWVIIPALVALFLFPLTLAYVIVVEKAMEVRVAIRTGLQYALASQGVRVVQIAVSIAVVTGTLFLATGGGLRRPQQMQMIAYGIVFVMLGRRVANRLQKWIDLRFFREAVDAERLLGDLGDKVRTIVEIRPLLATVTDTISETLHVARIAALVRQNGNYAPAHAVGYESTPAVSFSTKSAVAERLGQSRDAVRVSLARPDAWVTKEFEERKQLETLQTELLLPLAVKDRLLGFLSLGPKLSEEPYSATDVRLLQSVAAQTGLALENSRLTEAVATEVAQRERLNRELEIAREVQQRLFPQSGPQIPGLDYVGKCRPASSVGGDYYDFVSMCDGRLGIAIGDISGKGVPAALLMASLQASLRGLAIANPPALSTLMVNLNHLIYDASPSNRYATFFYGVYDPKSREFIYVNGGHNPPMVFRGPEVLRLEEGGPVVGLFGPAQYSQASIQLQSGDTMVLFTDGVSEAMNAADDEFDEPRLMEAVRSGAGLNASELIDHVMGACDAFVAGAPQHDDMTLVVVRVE
jgi:sigma-B regulation protein RsbU (phosphoserine phosphatase)